MVWDQDRWVINEAGRLVVATCLVSRVSAPLDVTLLHPDEDMWRVARASTMGCIACRGVEHRASKTVRYISNYGTIMTATSGIRFAQETTQLCCGLWVIAGRVLPQETQHRRYNWVCVWQMAGSKLVNPVGYPFSPSDLSNV